MPGPTPLMVLLIVIVLLVLGAVLIASALGARSRRCGVCQASNPDNAKFCARCGVKLR